MCSCFSKFKFDEIFKLWVDGVVFFVGVGVIWSLVDRMWGVGVGMGECFFLFVRCGGDEKEERSGSLKDKLGEGVLRLVFLGVFGVVGVEFVEVFGNFCLDL